MSEPKAVPPLDAKFARKVRASRWALLFERLWPRLWLIVRPRRACSCSSRSPACGRCCRDPLHYVLLAAFALAAVAALLHAVRTPFPSHEEAVRRIERVSGVPHRPASSYEDTITANADDPRTAAIWQAHRDAPRRGAVTSQGRPAASAHRPPGPDRPARTARARRRRPAGAGRRQHVRPPALRLPLQLGHRALRSAARRLGDAAVLHRQAAADAGRRRARPGRRPQRRPSSSRCPSAAC